MPGRSPVEPNASLINILAHFRKDKNTIFFSGESKVMKKLLFAVLCVFALCALSVAAADDDANTFSYTVTYNNLNAQVTQSHIHFGFPKETGGVMVFLCQTAAAPAPPTVPAAPTCPDTLSGTVSGTVTAANVIGPNS